MSETKLSVGVIFGSRSVEHDVSVVTATQVMKALNPQKYQVIPIYITRDGRWYTGSNLNQLRNFQIDDVANLAGTRETTLSPNIAHPGLISPPRSGRFQKSHFQPLDVVFPVVHGSHGEDGTLQGLLELANLPYVGAGVMASSIANDKAMTKLILKAHGIPVIEPYLVLSRAEWAAEREAWLNRLEAEIGFPCFVKPLTLGSSVGIAHVKEREALARYIDIASNLDRQVLVEAAAKGENIIEVNCAILGGDQLRASVLEQPISYREFLDFEEKYKNKAGAGMKGQQRLIPAPLAEGVYQQIQTAALAAFRAIRGRGTARLDFLVDAANGNFWLNEINTLPGSMAFYLWEHEGLSAGQVCEQLIQIALADHAQKRQTTYNYKSGLIELAASQQGAKGSKL